MRVRLLINNNYMSKSETKNFLTGEIMRVNREIDRKVLTGQSYRREAHYHRQLVTRLNHLSQQSFFGKLLGTLSIF